MKTSETEPRDCKVVHAKLAAVLLFSPAAVGRVLARQGSNIWSKCWYTANQPQGDQAFISQGQLAWACLKKLSM